MTEAKYVGRISPILSDNWTDNVPVYHSYYDFHMRRKAAKKQLFKERMIFFAVSVIVVCLCLSILTVRPESRETYADNERYTVGYGDTLWDIAKDYKSDDVTTGEFVYRIRKVNNMSTSEINPGDVLIIPE